MTTQNENPGQLGNDGTQGTPPAPPAAPTLDEVAADRDRWKALSRQNEGNFNSARTELQQLQAAQQVAVEAARTEGRTSALGEVSQELVTAELQLQAVKAGAELPDLSFLDLSRFKGENERPDADAVKSFIDSLPKPTNGGAFPHLAGAGHNRGADGKFASLDPTELADFISGGNFL
ncbi:hypothetical protein [Streptomyces sp. H27-H5]|uniref:hypothetical protein n=1 Tax=Streptomyces sp. H27-H5 TaxID=2996460 RepID=UPI0022721601|nr:hypothetical protein [Streptomyces sp. H27-H5]MCY0962741.1 hypothetical protein [Streptomyces sp. H27-H5]